jgi:Flp pilus assembly pilin Flp
MNKKNNKNNELGQGLTEYAIILSLIAIAAIASTAFFGAAIKSKIASLAGAIAGQEVSKIMDSEKKAVSAAQKAQKNASKVSGNMSIENNIDIFEEENL